MIRSPFVVFALFLLVQWTLPQSQSTTGNIAGRVTDPNGYTVAGILVSLTSRETGFSRSTNTGNDGTFTFILLRPGSYEIKIIPAAGFAAFVSENNEVTVGGLINLDIPLKVAGLANAVDIHSYDQGVEVERSSISTTIDENRIRNLPTMSRNFMEFAVLGPGIVRDPIRGGNLAVGGQIGTLNSLQVDGVSDDNTYFGKATGNVGNGRVPFQFSLEAVKEFQINQSGFSAEYGRSAGAVINVVTKSGTNRFHGSASWYFQDESLNSNSTNIKGNQASANLPNRRSPLQVNDFGGALGGPLKKDRIFFFAAYEGQPRTATNVPVLKSLPFAPPAVQSVIGPKLYPTCVCGQQGSFFIKTDLYINERQQAAITYNEQRFTGRNFVNSGLLTPEENNGIQSINTDSLNGSLTSTIRPKWLNEIRFQFSSDRQPAVPNLSTPQTSITSPSGGGFTDGPFSFGGNSTLPRDVSVTRYQVIDNQTYLLRRHTIRFGIDLLFDRIYNLAADLFHGSYTFSNYQTFNSSLTDPLGQHAQRYRQSFAGLGTTGPETHPNSTESGYFVQDDWRVSHGLTINVGLRYDYQKLAHPLFRNSTPSLLAAGFDTSFVPPDKNNFSPRAGISYAFNERTLIRGGVGIFYARTLAIMNAAAQAQNGVQVISIDLTCSPNTPLCPVYPSIFTTQPNEATIAPINLNLFDRNYKQPFTYQARVQFERQIVRNFIFSITYERFRGFDLSRTRNANLGLPTNKAIPIYDEVGPTGETLTFQQFPANRPVDEFRSIGVFESSARSLYHGLSFEFNDRSSGPLKFFVNYTLSNAKDDRPDQLIQNIDNSVDIAGMYGRSDVDVRHRFIFSPIFETGKFPSKNLLIRSLFSNFVLSGIYTAQSGAPYSAMISADANKDGVDTNDRVPGTVRNQFSTPPRYILDMRISRTIRFRENIRIMLFAEGFNVLNRSNISTLNNIKYTFQPLQNRLVSPTASFGAVRSFVAPTQLVNSSNASSNRAIQLGLRLEF